MAALLVGDVLLQNGLEALGRVRAHHRRVEQARKLRAAASVGLEFGVNFGVAGDETGERAVEEGHSSDQ